MAAARPSPGHVIPTAYRIGYEKAAELEPALAARYIRHTTVGDPPADAVAEDLLSLPPRRVHALLATVLQNPKELPPESPASLRRFIADVLEPPHWFDEEVAMIASRAFLRNSDTVLAALVAGSIVEGFATLISKSFRIRGRITSSGARRLKQNGLQLVEQYLPGGMSPLGDGWKLTLRVRLVHARVRLLIGQSDEWISERHGMPISAANVLLAGSAFSGRLMQHVAALGGDFTREEREAYVHVWRYTGLLIGIPEDILFSDEASAVRTFEVGRICEPPADEDAIIMANSIVNSAPMVIGITEPEARRRLAGYAYRISRGLIGDELAEAFLFPKDRRGAVGFLRTRNRIRRLIGRAVTTWRKKADRERFEALMDFVDLGRLRHSYSLPTTLYDEESPNW